MRVVQPPFDKYNFFHPANLHCIQSNIGSQMDFVLKATANGSPKCFKGRVYTWHPRLPTKSSILKTSQLEQFQIYPNLSSTHDTASKQFRRIGLTENKSIICIEDMRNYQRYTTQVINKDPVYTIYWHCFCNHSTQYSTKKTEQWGKGIPLINAPTTFEETWRCTIH